MSKIDPFVANIVVGKSRKIKEEKEEEGKKEIKYSSLESLYESGVLFAQGGSGVEKNPKLAFECFTRLVNREFMPAFLNLGQAYQHGYGVEKDLRKALSLYQKYFEYYDKKISTAKKEDLIQLVEAAGFAVIRIAQIYMEKEDFKQIINSTAVLEKYASWKFVPAIDFLIEFCTHVGKKRTYYKTLYPTISEEIFESCAQKRFYYTQLFLSLVKNHSEYRLELAKMYSEGIGTSKNVDKGYELLEEELKNQNPETFLFLGKCYLNGVGGRKNVERGIELLRKASKRGVAEAKKILGDCYLNGIGVDRDTIKAHKYFKDAAVLGNTEALYAYYSLTLNINYPKEPYRKLVSEFLGPEAEKGNHEAQNNLSFHYLFGFGMNVDYAKARKLLMDSAANGNPFAKHNLAWCYILGYGERNIQEGLKLLQEWALEHFYLDEPEMIGFRYGNNQIMRIIFPNKPEAWYIAGLCYKNGLAVQRNPELAFLYFKQSAQLYGKSAIEWAKCYEEGCGVTQNYEKALQIYRALIRKNRGNFEAYCHIAIHYLRGLGVAKDEALAVKMFNILIEFKHLPAWTYLGYCYEQGLGGLTQNHKKAVECYTIAAKQNCPMGKVYLAWMYENGLGVSQDPKVALEIYSDAAKDNDPDALYNLAGFIEEGEHIQANPERAFSLYALSEKLGNKAAHYKLEQLLQPGMAVGNNRKN